MCKVYTGYHGTSEIEHGLCACAVDNPLAKARVLSLRTGAQTIHRALILRRGWDYAPFNSALFGITFKNKKEKHFDPFLRFMHHLSST